MIKILALFLLISCDDGMIEKGLKSPKSKLEIEGERLLVQQCYLNYCRKDGCSDAYKLCVDSVIGE